jgi:hypothetical protein
MDRGLLSVYFKPKLPATALTLLWMSRHQCRKVAGASLFPAAPHAGLERKRPPDSWSTSRKDFRRGSTLPFRHAETITTKGPHVATVQNSTDALPYEWY